MRTANLLHLPKGNVKLQSFDLVSCFVLRRSELAKSPYCLPFNRKWKGVFVQVHSCIMLDKKTESHEGYLSNKYLPIFSDIFIRYLEGYFTMLRFSILFFKHLKLASLIKGKRRFEYY